MSRQTKGGKVPLFHSASAVDFYKEVILPWQEMQLLKTKHRTVTTAPTKQMQPARIMQKTPTTRQLPKTTLITPQKAATQTATMRTKWSNLSLSYIPSLLLADLYLFLAAVRSVINFSFIFFVCPDAHIIGPVLFQSFDQPASCRCFLDCQFLRLFPAEF